MQTLNEKIKVLEIEIEKLKTKIESLSFNVEGAKMKPRSTLGGSKSKSQNRPIGVSSGLAQIYGGGVIWNSEELELPPWGERPTEPTENTKAHNKHGHSRFAGGALDINTLELVEYDVDWEDEDRIWSKHCQGLWNPQPSIVKVEKEDGTLVDKIGNLDIEFDAESGKWIASAGEINVKTTNLVMREEDGSIKLDSKGQEMKSPLYSSEVNKTNIVWDEDAQCWRFYAVFKPYPE